MGAPNVPDGDGHDDQRPLPDDDDDLPDESQATLVRVVAEQFAWNVRYPGADGMFGSTDITLVGPDNPLGLDDTDDAALDDIITDRLNMPVNTPVLVMLSSKDVVHSFGLALMRVKQDAVRGLSCNRSGSRPR